MGIVMGVMGKGVPGLLSFPRDRIFDRCFKNVDSFEKFHLAFLNVCSEFNSIMPGNHFETPSLDRIEEFYGQWKNKNDETARKQYMVDRLKELMKPGKTGKAMVLTGLVAPSAAISLKRAAEGTPQIKKFRVDMVPDVVFVPSITLLALLGAKWYNLGAIHKNPDDGGEGEGEQGGGGRQGSKRQEQSQELKQEEAKKPQPEGGVSPPAVTSRTVSV